jgi:hypothetical protein
MIDLTKPKHLILMLSFIIVGVMAFLIFSFFFQTEVIRTYGVNKTIGWTWDYCEAITFFGLTSTLVYLLGYLALWSLRTRVNKLVSLLHILSIIAGSVIYFLAAEKAGLCVYSVWISVIGVILFLANGILAVIYKLADKN